MAGRSKKKRTNSGPLGFEATLWAAADKLRGNLDAAEYKHVVLGLIFLKYIHDAFEEQRAKLLAQVAEGADPEDADEYRAARVFWVPKAARWPYLQGKAKDPSIGKFLDDAMTAIEHDNPSLKGVLPKDYAKPGLDKARLGELIDLIGTIGLGDQESRSKDILGRVYEYFLSQFASAEGKKGGEFYTPRCVVRLLVEMLEPYKGRVYDPCCGSSGMFVQSEEFVRAHGGNVGDISIFGQEMNYTTWRLAKMNLAIRGIDGQIEQGDTFHADRHPDLKADFILANPPFNVSDWRGELLKGDKRWTYGAPPASNANFAWVQHIIHHLAQAGAAGFVVPANALTSETGGEDVIRRAIVNANLVDCVVMLPERLFYSTPIPASIWIVRRGREARSGEKRAQILFIDASACGTPTSRTHRELGDADLRRIAGAYRTWRGSPDGHHDEEAFCRSVAVEQVAENRYNLLPAAYLHGGHKGTRPTGNLAAILTGEASRAATVAVGHSAGLSKDLGDLLGHLADEVDRLEGRITHETHSLGELLEPSDERLGTRAEPEILTCTETGGLVLQRERFAKRVATDDTRRYKVVRIGDIVYNPYLLWKGAIDQCWIVETGITSPVYEVLRVREGFDRTVVGQLVISREMVKRYNGISFGTVQRRRRAPVERFLQLEVSVPVGEGAVALRSLLGCLRSCQVAGRAAERAARQFIGELCSGLR